MRKNPDKAMVASPNPPDSTFCGNMVHDDVSSAIVPHEPEEESPAPWTCEPTAIESLLDQYHIENKVPGRIPGTTLYLTLATGRNGNTTETIDNQRFKLFLVICLEHQVFYFGIILFAVACILLSLCKGQEPAVNVF